MFSTEIRVSACLWGLLIVSHQWRLFFCVAPRLHCPVDNRQWFNAAVCHAYDAPFQHGEVFMSGCTNVKQENELINSQ